MHELQVAGWVFDENLPAQVILHLIDPVNHVQKRLLRIRERQQVIEMSAVDRRP